MNPEPGQAEPGNLDHEMGSRELQFTATHDRPGERSKTAISYGSGNSRRHQLPDGADASCANRRRRSRNTSRSQEPTPPPPDWGPTVQGEILLDSGWMTTNGRNVRLWAVRGISSGSIPEWSHRLLPKTRQPLDESGTLDNYSKAANAADPDADPEGNLDLSDTGVPVRLPRKPVAPAGAVALALPVAAD